MTDARLFVRRRNPGKVRGTHITGSRSHGTLVRAERRSRRQPRDVVLGGRDQAPIAVHSSPSPRPTVAMATVVTPPATVPVPHARILPAPATIPANSNRPDDAQLDPHLMGRDQDEPLQARESDRANRPCGAVGRARGRQSLGKTGLVPGSLENLRAVRAGQCVGCTYQRTRRRPRSSRRCSDW